MIVRGIAIALSVVLFGCSPVSFTRIGPAMSSREKGCEVLVLPPGDTPDRPHRDIGMVHLSNCQEYTVGLCRGLLVKSVCELGGNVAYLPEPHPPKNELDSVNYRVTAAIYISELPTTTDELGQKCQEPPPEDTDPEIEHCME